MESFLKDLRFAVRSLLKRPALFAVATLSLAVGISANTTIFAAIDAYLVRPLPYPDADQIVQLWTTNQSKGWRRASSSIPDFHDLRAASRTTQLAAMTGGSFNLSGKDRAERVQGSRVSGSFFSVMGVPPLLGRAFTDADEQIGAGGSVVLSYDFWQRRFAGDRGILGQTLVFDGKPFSVIGIMPAEFKYPSNTTNVWTPLVQTGSERRDSRFIQMIGRVRKGTTHEAALGELRSIAARLASTYAEDAGTSVNVVRLHDAIYDEQFRRGATISMIAVMFVLLIACANVANLLLARATGRGRELALRTALGAGRTRLMRQLLTESVVLAVAGGIFGALLSIWGVNALVAIIPPDFARTETIALDGRALLFTMAISLGCGLLFGFAPALQATRANLNSALREGGRGGTVGVRHNRLGAALVIAEISLALVLLISAGLLIKGAIKLQQVDLGFDPRDVLTARVSLAEAQYPDSVAVAGLHQRMLAGLRDLPGIQEVGATTDLPFQGGSGTFYQIDGEAKAEPGREPVTQFRAITPGYLESMRIALVKGRPFAEQDRLASPFVVIVNETFARRHWPNGDALGRRVVLSTGGPREIVGIVRDSREFGPGDDPPVMLYVPALQRTQRNLAYTVRSSLPPQALATAVRKAVATIDPTLPLYSVQTMTEVMEIDQRGNNIMPRLLGVFGGIALLLAVMGVYGVMSYSVSQRTQEMGIRMALGAQGGDILRLVVRQGGTLALIGLVVGLGLAAGATRGLSFFLLGVSAYDPTVFAGVSLALAAAALTASVIPARRALKVDPLVALRSD
jgi:putative ABC transport system permease protein